MLPDYKGVIVHDGLALYDTVAGAAHAQCNAHLVRHLAAVGVVWGQTAWTTAMTTCLFEAKAAADAARDKDEPAVAPELIAGFEARYDEALAQTFAVRRSAHRPGDGARAAGASTSARHGTWPLA